MTYRVRADLADTTPPVWRRLEVSSSLMLDQVHVVLQAAFGFEDAHLHRFAVGLSGHDDTSTVYLCPWEVEDGDTDGVDEREVRLDELLAEPGEQLQYLYDYGDGWEIRLKLETVLDRAADALPARCVAGRRAGPPEDCGGPWGFEELVEAGEVDTEFDLAETDEDVQSALAGAGLPSLLAEVVRSLPPGGVAGEVAELVRLAELTAVPAVDAETAERMTTRYRWLVERAGADGVRLTSAGFLPPALVKAAMDDLQLDPLWIGAANREDVTRPVAAFRQSAQALELVRKVKGRLTATAAVRKLAADPALLWRYVAEHAPLGREGTAERHASVLALLWTAAGRSVRSEAFETFGAAVMTELGWTSEGRAIESWQVDSLSSGVTQVLEDTLAIHWRSQDESIAPGGVLLARTALASHL